MMVPKKSTARSQGFTIIEFMIATTVFSVILMGVTAAVLHIGRAHQHSLYASATQAASRNLVDSVAQSVKFSAGDVSFVDGDDTDAWCVGNRQFLFVPGRQLAGTNPATTTNHAVLTRQNVNGTCPVTDAVSGPVSGQPNELLGKSMRIAKLRVDPGPGEPALHIITARVLYGDDNLFCLEGDPANSCDPSSNLVLTLNQLQNDNVRCRSTSGAQFCAVSELSVSVYRRL